MNKETHYTPNPRRALYDGRAIGRAEIAVILQDLIAELREHAAVHRAHPVWAKEPERWEAMADRAEDRLKGLDDG